MARWNEVKAQRRCFLRIKDRRNKRVGLSPGLCRLGFPQGRSESRRLSTTLNFAEFPLVPNRFTSSSLHETGQIHCNYLCWNFETGYCEIKLTNKKLLYLRIRVSDMSLSFCGKLFYSERDLGLSLFRLKGTEQRRFPGFSWTGGVFPHGTVAHMIQAKNSFYFAAQNHLLT